jgi:ATP-dependent 26S proteasome regulatory subunit
VGSPTVISLESQQEYSGRGGTVKVHRLRSVQREDVILPEKTLALLDRNVGNFIKARSHIKSLGLSAKKGLLFYGPPGTGKTLTIHYLASHLPQHTTLLITAEQVGLLDEYFRLARFLQPSLVVVEDVDLIARAREEMGSICEEVLLNKLLNEMDGLREDADVLFILTTNRPDQLEPALASRPGRIDQAIEFPLPDEQGRSKLIKLYARGVQLSEPLTELIVRRTKGVSPAFIKELMRRAAQFQFEIGEKGELKQSAVDNAIEEMVFSGGALNLKLLGGSSTDLGSASDAQFLPSRPQ